MAKLPWPNDKLDIENNNLIDSRSPLLQSEREKLPNPNWSKIRNKEGTLRSELGAEVGA